VEKICIKSFFHKFLCVFKYYSGESINKDEMGEELRTNVRYVKCIQNFGKKRMVNLRTVFMWTINILAPEFDI
jgi:hypothetical protein